MKKHSLLGKQMEPHISETMGEKAADSMSRQQVLMEQDQRRPLQTLPTSKAAPSKHTAHPQATRASHRPALRLQGVQAGSAFSLHPQPKNSTRFLFLSCCPTNSAP